MCQAQEVGWLEVLKRRLYKKNLFLKDKLTASSDGISYVSFDTLADAAMAGRSTVSIWATGPFYTRIRASIIAQLAVLRVGALVIHSAFQDGDAHSVGTHFKVRWTDAALAIG